MMDLPENGTCPKCGASLPHDAPRGMCTRCLLTVMLEQGPPISPIADLDLPRSFGSYELIEELARGGMGIVYKARQTQLNRMVALKVIAAGPFASPDFLARFRTEAETAAGLDHPHIVPIYEVGEFEGQPFFSMKLVEGGALSHQIANSGSCLFADKSAALMTKLARAVHYAHQHGVLHRDIKPGNVLVDHQGEPHLTDFGLARLVERNSSLTRSMAMLGTPSYMSPEQARGDTKRLTTAVDVYGLGALFYEVLTGYPPFAAGTTMETVHQVLEREPRRPSALRSGIDRDLETICLKCLEKQPAHRYGSAEALAADLDRWQRHEPIHARAPSPVERFAKWVRRNAGAFTAIVTIGLLLLGGIILSTWQAGVQRELRRRAELNERQAIEARELAAGEAEQRRHELVRLHVAAGNERVGGGDSFGGLLQFGEALRLEQGDAGREDVHRRRLAVVIRTSPRLRYIWSRSPNGVASSRFSPDGSRIVCGDPDGGVRVFNVEDGLPVTPSIGPEYHPRLAWFTRDGRFLVTADVEGMVQHWYSQTAIPAGPLLPTRVISVYGRTYSDCFDYSPDCRRLLAVLPRGVQLFSVPKGEIEGPLLAETTKVSRVRFSPDGHSALITGDRPSLQIVEIPSGKIRWSIEDLGDWARFGAFSPDGRKVATASGFEQEWTNIDVWDAVWGTRLIETVRSLSSYDLVFSPDGRWLALGDNADALVLDVRTGQPIGDRMRHGSHISQYEFSPSGKQLVTASFDRTACVWDVATSQALIPALRHGALVFEARFSPDGRRLVTASFDAITRLWDLPERRGERLALAHGLAEMPTICLSPDNRQVLLFDGYEEAQVWDMQSGKLVERTLESQAVAAAAFCPDGSSLALAFADGKVRVRSTLAGPDLLEIAAHPGGVTCLAFNRDGTRLLTAGMDGTSRIWNPRDGSSLVSSMTHNGPVRQAMFSADGTQVLTGGDDNTVRLWDALSGTSIGKPLELATRPRVALLSSDGKHILTVRHSMNSSTPGATQLWNATTGRPVSPEAALPTIIFHSAAFSPDGSRYLYTYDASSVALCDAATGRRLVPLLQHRHQPGGFSFSPDGKLVMTYASPAARVWDAATGEPVSPPLMHKHHIMTAEWSRDGRKILTTSLDRVLRIWDVSPAEGTVTELIQQAELLSAHRLDPQIGMVPLTQEEVKMRWHAVKQ